MCLLAAFNDCCQSIQSAIEMGLFDLAAMLQEEMLCILEDIADADMN